MTSASTIRDANAVILRRRPELNRAAREIALAIGLLETGFGVEGTWLLEDGTPSYNWGGLVGAGTNGSLVHKDRNPDGSPTEYKFKAFYNQDEAFDAFYATWSHGDVAGIGHPDVKHELTVLPAAARGDARAVATTMYAHGYYGGVAGDAQARIEAYAKAILGASKTVASALGEANEVKDIPSGSATKPPLASRAKAAAIAAGTALAVAVKAPIVPAIAVGTGVFWFLQRMRGKAAPSA